MAISWTHSSLYVSKLFWYIFTILHFNSCCKRTDICAYLWDALTWNIFITKCLQSGMNYDGMLNEKQLVGVKVNYSVLKYSLSGWFNHQIPAYFNVRDRVSSMLHDLSLYSPWWMSQGLLKLGRVWMMIYLHVNEHWNCPLLKLSCRKVVGLIGNYLMLCSCKVSLMKKLRYSVWFIY